MKLDEIRAAIEQEFRGEVDLEDDYERELKIRTRFEDGTIEQIWKVTLGESVSWNAAALETHLANLRDHLNSVNGGWIELDKNGGAGFPMDYGEYSVRIERGDSVKQEETITLWLKRLEFRWRNPDGTVYQDPYPTRFLRCRLIGSRERRGV